MTRDPEERVQELIAETRHPTAWFERLYAEAEAGQAEIPWGRRAPNPRLEAWASGLNGDGRSALVVGCGLGDDAEFVSSLGFDTTAFDIAPSAIRAAERRFPDSSVNFVVADLLDPPAEWRHAFDLVVEIITVQALPDPPRAEAIRRVSEFVAPGGTLIVISAARDEEDGPVDGPPWPLTRAEIEAFASGGVEVVRIEELVLPGDPVHRWRAEFRRS